MLLSIFLAVQATSMQPSGKWTVAHEEEYCVASRAYGSGADTILVGVRPVTWGDVGDVLLIVPNSERRGAYTIEAGTVTLPNGDPISGRMRSWATTDRARRIIAIEVPRARIAEIAAASTLAITAGDRSLTVAQNGSAAVARALNECENGLIASLPEAAATDATVVPRAGDRNPAAATGNPAYWITSDDYPSEAVDRGYEGVTAARWVIDPDGRVRRCWITQRSDHPGLDSIVCRVLRARARYKPARDVRGEAIAQTSTRRVIWKIPPAGFPRASRLPD